MKGIYKLLTNAVEPQCGQQLALGVKPSSQYDASHRVRKNRTNFYSSVWVKTGARRDASVGNGSEPASSELRVATRHIVN